jgi:hypothetical protein
MDFVDRPRYTHDKLEDTNHRLAVDIAKHAEFRITNRRN